MVYKIKLLVQTTKIKLFILLIEMYMPRVVSHENYM